jgi:hypothetical protein
MQFLYRHRFLRKSYGTSLQAPISPKPKRLSGAVTSYVLQRDVQVWVWGAHVYFCGGMKLSLVLLLSAVLTMGSGQLLGEQTHGSSRPMGFEWGQEAVETSSVPALVLKEHLGPHSLVGFKVGLVSTETSWLSRWL